ncbi:hypothetical protein D3C80_1501980 [compost metagenome]
MSKLSKGSATISEFVVPLEKGAQNIETVNKYADDIVQAEEWIGSPVWPHKPLRIVEVDGKKIILDGHHRYEAGLKAKFTGLVPFVSVPIRQSGYTIEELKDFIKSL